MKELIGIYGASGFGREVKSGLRRHLDQTSSQVVFIDDFAGPNLRAGDVEILSWEAFLERPAERKAVAIAIADAKVRQVLFERCGSAEIPMYPVVSPNTEIGENIVIAEGAILQSFVTLTSDIVIGRCFHANIYSYVAHDCVLGDFVTFAPHVMCNGNVHVGDYAYVGTGAVIRQGTRDRPLLIGEGAVVGMGAVVTKDVPAGATVVGNPARILEKS